MEGNGADGLHHIDEAVLLRLVDDLGPEQVVDLCRTFLVDAQERVRALRIAGATGDADAASRAAHLLKSAAGFVGAGGVSARCRELEELARQDRRGGIPACIEVVAKELDHACAELFALIGRLSPTR